jgi:hypothetical protein
LFDQICLPPGCLKRFVYNWCYNRKLSYMKAGYSQAEASPIADKLVFGKVRAGTGAGDGDGAYAGARGPRDR